MRSGSSSRAGSSVSRAGSNTRLASTSATKATTNTKAGNESGGGSNLSVWEVAVTEARRRRTEATNLELDKVPRETTLLIVGTRSAVKDVCHLWELGGGALFTPLLATPLTARAMARLTLLVVVDLSRPDTIWSDLETLLSSLKAQVNKTVESVSGLKESLQEEAKKRIQSHHEEGKEVKPFLVPLVIIGGKYDIFKDLEPEGKKLICRALRYVAHTHGASLHFFSAKDAGLIKKSMELLSHYAFGTTESRSLAQDYNQPLIIPAGTDSLATINMNDDLNLDKWKHIYTTRFPQESEERSSVLPEDPGRDPTYAEPDVDNLRTQKDEELERIRREVGRNSARWAELELT
nr:cytoplasmic dynein 2 light intermediate chain 1-like isoform X2 [Procambarus clarkii]